jgi:hypothetical protein
MPRIRVPRHVTRLVAPLIVDYFASCRLVLDYFDYAAHPGASAHRAARHVARRAARHAACRATHRRLLRLAPARHRLLRLHLASGCLGMSRSSSRGSSRRSSPGSLRRSSATTSPRAGSSSTTSTTPRVRVPRHVARLVMWLIAPLVTRLVAPLLVDYVAYAARPGAFARRAARQAARCRLLRLEQAHRRLLRLRRASGCFGTSRGSSHGSSSTTPCIATSSCGHTGSTLATSCVMATCLAATLAQHQLRRASPRRRLLVASRRPFISTSFPN